MTTLETIAFTFAGGSAVFLTGLTLFGAAVKRRCVYIAPRCTARPRDVIYNPKPAHSSQDRGGPWLGWIRWTLGLTYPTMLEGVPGTGTRKGGLEGSNLSVNLDGIVLLRFHATCLRVAMLATFLCIAVILPVNLTARCSILDDGGTNATQLLCLTDAYNLTNYERTTLANIPSLGLEPVLTKDGEQVFENTNSIWGQDIGGLLGRLYGIVLCSWIITIFSCYSLRREWYDILAMRRVYYLEYDIWHRRKQELAETLLKENEEEDNGHHISPKQRRKKKKKDPSQFRDPWIPHPEQRDTVPNISLYSVLVGGLPNLPAQVVDEGDVEMAVGFSKRQSIDWQLGVTTAFFDQCVPNQPGFSSSVVAVTILPDAPAIANAWKKWFAHAGALRRLRFIRRLIEDLRHFDIVEEEEFLEQGMEIDSNGRMQETVTSRKQRPRAVYRESVRNAQYYKEVLTSYQDEEVEDLFLIHLEFGPEQTAVYSRELAQSAAQCCPNGCGEQRLRRARIDELLILQDEALVRVEEAYKNLQEARDKVASRQGEAQQEVPDLLDQPDPVTNMDALPHDLKMETQAWEKYNQNALGLRTNPSRHGGTNDDPFDNIERNDIFPNMSVLSGDKVAPSAASETLPTGVETAGSQSVEGPASMDGRNIDPFGIEQNGTSLPRQETEQQQVPDLLDQPGPLPNMEAPLNGMQTGPHGLRKTDRNSLGLRIDPVKPAGSSETGRNIYPASSGQSDAFPDLSTVRMRRRTGTFQSDQWAQVEHIVNDGDWEGLRKIKKRHAALGGWKLPSFKELVASVKELSAKLGQWAFSKTTEVVDNLDRDLARESTYAVVTFTSRQAAVAARNCLTDGRGQMRWVGEKSIPVPPLADAGACDWLTCRGCCRPVTLSIPDKQKLIRKFIAFILLAAIYVFYTIPLTFASNLANPENLENIFPFLKDVQEDWNQTYNLLSGLIVALIWTFFFSLCPVMFKMISNSGSAATSVVAAEYRALQYFWWFMLITAFSGNLLSTMVIRGFNVDSDGGFTIGTEAQRVLVEIASTIPTQIAASWINWIIVRFTITLPLNYMLQFNTFLFSCLGWNCCKRLVMGGGPGGPLPYRVYVDSGVAYLCIVALAPASPLVAPCALLYFLYCQPLFRRNLIFMYRPKFDGGGIRWPFLFDIMISSLLVGQILLTTMMALKQAIGPALMGALPFIPTLVFRYSTRKRFLRAFMDAALLQTSNLDMWDNTQPTSLEKREEFRRFLVDSHKASYVPVCIAGRDDGKKTLTAEPAVVVTHPNDYTDDDMVSIEESDSINELHELLHGEPHRRKDASSQYGASLRRVSAITPSHSDPHGHLAFHDDGSVSALLAPRRGSVRGVNPVSSTSS